MRVRGVYGPSKKKKKLIDWYSTPNTQHGITGPKSSTLDRYK